MNRLWKYVFRGTTLAGAALLCVSFWLPMAHGCNEVIIPANDVQDDASKLVGIYLPFLLAAVTVLLLLLKWLLRHRVAQAIVIALACIVSVGALGYFGALWIYTGLPDWVEHGVKWDRIEFLLGAMPSITYVFAGIALYALYKCPRRIYFVLSIFWNGLLPLVFFSSYGIILGQREIMYGFDVAWAASGLMCAGAVAELIRQWKAPQLQMTNDTMSNDQSIPNDSIT